MLKKKSLNTKEINSRIRTLRAVQKEKVGMHLNHFLCWSSFILLGLTNVVGVFALLPALMALSGWKLNVIVTVMGLAFGIVFSSFIHSLHHLEKKHHILAWIFMPIIAVLDIFLLLGLNEFLVLKLNAGHDNIAVTITLFIVGFLVPYAIAVITGKFRLR